MKITVKNWDFSDSDRNIELPDFATIFANKKKERNKDLTEEDITKLQKDIISQTIRWQLAKRRSGNASTKTRSDVSGTTRKPWAQKETGRARQGSLRAPHFRGGGVVFGPHPRSYEYKLNKKFKRLALALTINLKALDGNLLVLDSFKSNINKTKDFSNWLLANQLKSVLFVGDVSEPLKKSFGNLYGVDSMPLVGLNVLSCVEHQKVIFDLAAVEMLIGKHSIVDGGENA